MEEVEVKYRMKGAQSPAKPGDMARTELTKKVLISEQLTREEINEIARKKAPEGFEFIKVEEMTMK